MQFYCSHALAVAAKAEMKKAIIPCTGPRSAITQLWSVSDPRPKRRKLPHPVTPMDMDAAPIPRWWFSDTSTRTNEHCVVTDHSNSD